MAGWHDPPHDQVTLTSAELDTLARLEQVLREGQAGSERRWWRRPRARRIRRRGRLVTLCLRWSRLAPWALPAGLLVMLAGLTSLPVAASGALLVTVGLAALVRRPHRARRPRARRRRARRPWDRPWEIRGEI